MALKTATISLPSSKLLASPAARMWFARLTLGLICVFVTAKFFNVSYDDAFITYRYAWNLATGHGFVYNVGDHYLGMTAPLYGIALGLLGAPSPDSIPHISSVLSGLSLLATALAILRIGKNHGSGLMGFFAGLIYLSLPGIHLVMGAEMIAQVALMTWAFVFVDEGKWGSASLCAVLGILTRPDGLAVIPVLLYCAWKTRRVGLDRTQRSLLVASVVGMASFFLWQKWYFDSWLPHSVSQKIGEVPVRGVYLAGAFRYLKDAFFTDRYATVGGLVIVGLALCGLFIKRKEIAPLLAWVGVAVLSYIVIRAPCYFWYLPIVYMAISVLAGSTLMWLSQRPHAKVATALAVAAFVVFNLPLCLSDGHDNARKMRYISTGKWLDLHAPPQAKMVCGEVGWLGYYAHHLTVIDTPGVIAYIPVHDAVRVVANNDPDVVIGDPGGDSRPIKRLLATPWFSAYALAAEFRWKNSPPLQVYLKKSEFNKFGLPSPA